MFMYVDVDWKCRFGSYRKEHFNEHCYDDDWCKVKKKALVVLLVLTSWA